MDVLDYDSLVSSYYQNLYTTLRNFRPGPDFLESWVHDEDHSRSILGLYEAAESGNLENLALKIKPETAKQINRDWLTAQTAALGELTFNETPDGLVATLQFGKKMVTQTRSVHPAYHAALQLARQNLRYSGTTLPQMEDHTAVEYSAHGTTLRVLVNGLGFVVHALHSGETDLEAGLIDRLCAILCHRPLQEGADHGVIRLELALRDPQAPRPVPGLITPDNADPIFRLATELVRGTFAKYQTLIGQGPQPNEWEDALSHQWATLNDEDRLVKVTEMMAEIGKRLKTSTQGLQILAIKNQTRIVLAHPPEASHPLFGHKLMQIEGLLKKLVEPRLEIILESLEDRNRREARTSRDTVFGQDPKSDGKEV